MKTRLLLGAAVLLSGLLNAAESSPLNLVTNAAKALSSKPNYSWKTTVVVPEGSRWRPGPTEGKTEKDGYTHVTMTFGENKSEMVFKGEKGALNTPDEGWQSLAELENSEGRSRFFARMLRNYKTPAVEAGELAAAVKELKKTDETYGGDLSEEKVKGLLTFRGRGSGGDGPEVSDAKGWAKFWVKDGLLTKFEYHVQGKVTFNNNEMEVDRKTTVEIKEVGTTKLSVPEEARKKLS